jgi:GT2 family glycosyltransferase
LLERIGFADERFFFFGFDPDLSLKVQIDEGLLVLGCREALVHHEEDIDDRKLQDLAQGALDNKYLFEKWALPEPGTYPDPQPGYSDVIRRKVVPHSDQRGGNSLTHSV